MRTARALALPALAFLAQEAAAQQFNGSVDIGSTRITYADSISATALSLSPALRLVADRITVTGSGTLAHLRGALTSSGRAEGGLTAFRSGNLSGEVIATAGGSAHSNATRSGQFTGGARLHASGITRGVWIGGAAGRTWDGTWRNMLQGDAGAWLQGDAGLLTAFVTPVIVDDTIRYMDALLGWGRSASAWDLDASLGVRAGEPVASLPSDRRLWGSASVTWWSTPRIGVVAAAGTYPVDLTQGYPGGRYVSVSARLRLPTPGPVLSAVRPVEGVAAFSVVWVSGDGHLVRVRAPSARTVEVSGDFTAWKPVTLKSAGGGWWTTDVTIPPGTHEIALRIDGGEWRAPPTLVVRTDEFGGEAGLLIVP